MSIRVNCAANKPSAPSASTRRLAVAQIGTLLSLAGRPSCAEISRVSGTEHPAPSSHWSYNDTASWGGLCSTGKEQSPVALGSVAGVKTPAVVFSYPANVDVDFRIRSDGCPQADVKDGDAWVEVDGIRHHLVQIHWHAPAEHAVGGRTQSDMEAHFVHSPPLVYAVLLNAAGKVVDPVLEAALSCDGVNNASRQLQLSSVVPTGDLLEYWYGSCRFQPTVSLNSSHS